MTYSTFTCPDCGKRSGARDGRVACEHCGWNDKASMRDDDNCISESYKGLQDGLKNNLVPDDSHAHIRLHGPEIHTDPANKRLELHITRRKADDQQ